MDTPIEVLTHHLASRPDVVIEMVLVPEQCALIYMNGVAYHVTIERAPQ
jgi:hypothetical protein